MTYPTKLKSEKATRSPIKYRANFLFFMPFSKAAKEKLESFILGFVKKDVGKIVLSFISVFFEKLDEKRSNEESSI